MASLSARSARDPAGLSAAARSLELCVEVATDLHDPAHWQARTRERIRKELLLLQISFVKWLVALVDVRCFCC